jgi:hypothetical protein
MNKLTNKEEKAKYLHKGGSITLVEFDSIDDYLNSAEDITKEIKKKYPIRYFLKMLVYEQEHVQFLIRDLLVKKQTNDLKNSLVKWYILSKNDEDVTAFFNFSEHIYRDKRTRIEISGLNKGDLATVVLSAPYGKTKKYSEIYCLANQKYLK